MGRLIVWPKNIRREWKRQTLTNKVAYDKILLIITLA